MPLPLPDYCKIRNKYCIAYYGNNKEFVVQLLLLKPFMEKEFPEVEIYFSFKDNNNYLLCDASRIIEKDNLKENRHMYGAIRELLCDMKSNPVYNFMKESDIPCGPIKTSYNLNNKTCVIITQGILPTKCMTKNQIDFCVNYAKIQGFDTIINGDINQGDWIISVENEKLYLAANICKKITMISNEISENLIKEMFPYVEILKIDA